MRDHGQHLFFESLGIFGISTERNAAFGAGPAFESPDDGAANLEHIALFFHHVFEDSCLQEDFAGLAEIRFATGFFEQPAQGFG